MKDKHGKEITNYDIQKEMWERCKRQAELCEDCVSRKSLKHKLQERHDFFIDAYGGFINLPQKDKARVDAIATCIAMVVNEPPVKPTQKKEQDSILNKIRAEIEAQEKWLAEAGYNAYNVSIAFESIKHALGKLGQDTTRKSTRLERC